MRTPIKPMKYRFLGDSGLLVSTFGVGCMVLSDADVGSAYAILKRAFEHGINFWDTAEIYYEGASERGVGLALQRGIDDGVWSREDIVLATKLFACTMGPNSIGLSRKHLIEGTKASLERLGVDYVDVLFCHRPEKYTPMEEVVRAMNFIINQGWAFYWGTSEWAASDILEACEVADRLGLIRPIVEQPRYHLLARTKVEAEFAALYMKYKLGLTTFSPLAYGLLTGKYAHGVPAGTRFSEDFYRDLFAGEQDKDVSEVIRLIEQLRLIAEDIGCSMAQLAIAWVASNPNVSTVLLGVKSLEQLEENLVAWNYVEEITPEIKARIEMVLPFQLRPHSYDEQYTMREQYL